MAVDQPELNPFNWYATPTAEVGDSPSGPNGEPVLFPVGRMKLMLMSIVTFGLCEVRGSAVLVVWLLAMSGAFAAEAQKPDLLLVYWSSEDCRWCTYWESSVSGMERRLKESAEFKKIAYRVIKNKRLADPYTRDDFPQDIAWLFERVQRGEEKRSARPGWVVYVDRKRVATFYGTRDWDEKHLPEIKRLVAKHGGS